MIRKNAKIYIAGHSGLVGNSTVKVLRKAGFNNLLLISSDILNLLEQSSVDKFFMAEEPEYVILSAAKVGGIYDKKAHPAKFMYENLQIQNNVLWSAKKVNVKKLIFIASAIVYPKNSPQPIKEEYFMQGNPESVNESYAHAKIAGTKLCEYIYDEFGLKFITCMPTNIYGEGDSFDPNKSHVIPSLIRRMHEAKLKNEKDLQIHGCGDTEREFMHVEDFSKALLWMLENYHEKEFINIGVGKTTSIRHLSNLIKDVVGYEGKVRFEKDTPEDVPLRALDSSKIFKAGWAPTIDLRTGIERTYSWYKESIDYKV